MKAYVCDRLGRRVSRRWNDVCAHSMDRFPPPPSYPQVLKEAAMQPLRELGAGGIRTVKEEQLRPLMLDDFDKAMRVIRPSVSAGTVEQFTRWLKENGY